MPRVMAEFVARLGAFTQMGTILLTRGVSSARYRQKSGRTGEGDLGRRHQQQKTERNLSMKLMGRYCLRKFTSDKFKQKVY